MGSQLGVFVFSLNTHRTPAVLRVTHPQLSSDYVHLLRFWEGRIGTLCQVALIAEYQTFDVAEAVVEDSQDTSMPAAVWKNTQVLAENLPVGETPVLLSNADFTYLTVYFKNLKTATLLSMVCTAEGIALAPQQTLENIDGFAWSYLPSKFAIISSGFVYIYVLPSPRSHVGTRRIGRSRLDQRRVHAQLAVRRLFAGHRSHSHRGGDAIHAHPLRADPVLRLGCAPRRGQCRASRGNLRGQRMASSRPPKERDGPSSSAEQRAAAPRERSASAELQR